MAVTIKQVQTKQDYKLFVNFLFKHYKGVPYWVPPMVGGEIKTLQEEHNPAFEFCEARFWLAYRGDEVVGRIGAIINKQHNEQEASKVGRFSRVEFIDDAEVADKLFEVAETWMKEKGMTTVQGPLGFNNLDHQGMLVEGFDYLQSSGSVYHFPYYKTHLERLGYAKEKDWVEFHLTLEKLNEKAIRVAEIIKRKYKLRRINCKNTKELAPWVPKIFHVLNQSFSPLFSFTPFNERMVQFYLEKYFKLINADFVKLIVDEHDELLGFIIALPSMSNALQKAKGRFYPFGWYHLLKANQKNDSADLFLTGVLPEKQKLGIAALLITELQQTFADKNITHIETTGIFEDNHSAITHWKEYKHIQHKRKRCFIKELS